MRSFCSMAVLAIHLQLALDVGRIHACNIPVFRYALQRWEPDNYELVVLHRQSLNDEQLELLRSLEVAREDPVSPVNINVRLVALDQPLQQQISAARARTAARCSAPLTTGETISVASNGC